MDLCVLPQTGASEQWLVLAAVGIVVVGAGIALATSGRARRRVATGMAALAIVGALVVGSVGAAAPAQADAGTTDCITAPATPAPAAETVVTPTGPTATGQCYFETDIQLPNEVGIDYLSSRVGDLMTITAVAQPGYRLADDAVALWQYSMAPQQAVSPVDAPVRTTATLVDSTAEANLFEPEDATLVPTLQAASEAGDFSYSFDATTGAALAYRLDFVDADGAPLPSATVWSPMDGGALDYDLGEGLYRFSTTLTPEEQQAVVDVLNQRATAEIASDPTRTLVGVTQLIDGLWIRIAFGFDTVCGVRLDEVELDAILFSESLDDAGPGAVPGFAGQGFPGVDALMPDAAQATEAPVSEAPATDAPAEEAPAPEVPATDGPATEAPEADEPAEEPAIEVVESREPEAITPIDG